LYSSPNTVRVNKLRGMRRSGHVARLGRRKMHTIFWLGKLKGRDHLGDVGIDGKVILIFILGKWGGKLWTEFILLRIGTSWWLL